MISATEAAYQTQGFLNLTPNEQALQSRLLELQEIQKSLWETVREQTKTIMYLSQTIQTLSLKLNQPPSYSSTDSVLRAVSDDGTYLSTEDVDLDDVPEEALIDFEGILDEDLAKEIAEEALDELN